jgi:hypothetical protein
VVRSCPHVQWSPQDTLILLVKPMALDQSSQSVFLSPLANAIDVTNRPRSFRLHGVQRPIEATQIHRPANGTFACEFCDGEVYSWSGRYDYTNWRSVRRTLN